MMNRLYALTTVSSITLFSALAASGVSGCAASTNSDPTTQQSLDEDLKNHKCDVRTAPRGSTPMVSTELIFGLDRKGTPIPETDFAAFVDAEITPRFPDGLSIIDVKGQYRMSTGQIIKEPSKLLLVYHDGSRQNSQKLEDIRTAYKTQFEQESVLRTDEIICVAF
ncbi:DUF3574 domain-containing protein [Pendulispora brunnea]|uniref:DUF3574 domain-containing protein n=1 Tax=Pendulispora brunnea TaxID=2905690 RepID=A0ABZ2KMN3_9BACT